MNWQQVKTNWSTVSGKVHTKWAKLTDEDMKAIDGKRDELVRRLETRYKYDHKKAESEVEAFAKTIN